jgi:hypothetical protein
MYFIPKAIEMTHCVNGCDGTDTVVNVWIFETAGKGHAVRP